MIPIPKKRSCEHGTPGGNYANCALCFRSVEKDMILDIFALCFAMSRCHHTLSESQGMRYCHRCGAIRQKNVTTRGRGKRKVEIVTFEEWERPVLGDYARSIDTDAETIGAPLKGYELRLRPPKKPPRKKVA